MIFGVEHKYFFLFQNDRRHRHTRTTWSEMHSALQIVQSIAGQVSDAFEQAHPVKLSKCSNIQLMLNESCWFKNIIANIQAKYQASSTTFNVKIYLLTLLPEDWKFSQVKEYVQCTYYMFSEVKKLRENISKYRLICYLYIHN